MELEAVPLVVQDLTESVFTTVSTAAESKDLDLSLDVDDTAPSVILGDPVRLRQILLNLVGNAIKFTDAGAVTVGVTGYPHDTDPSITWIRFEISDSGIGIASERLDQLFQPFQQAEASTTRRFGGTGLGLSICERLVTIMGGRIGVDSSVGDGTTFWFEIPAELSAVRPVSPIDDVDLSDVAILVVTRPGPLGEQIAKTLSRRAATVEHSTDGKVDPAPFDVVIADGRLGHVAITMLMGSGSVLDEQDVTGAFWIKGVEMNIPRVVALNRPLGRDQLIGAAAAVLGRASMVQPARANAEQLPEPSIAAPTVEEAIAEGRLILVAEDNETNRLVVRRQLALLGYAVETANDGVEALTMWRSGGFSLVLSDCHMPNMDGYQLTAAIREAEAGTDKRTPIVALTANAMAGEAERCLAAGMDGYLAKPVTLGIMSDTLGQWLGGTTREPARLETEQETAPEEATDMPIDLRVIEEILGSADPDMVASMLDVFQRSYQSLSEKMEDAVTSHDAKALREVAHSAKGAAASAGATKLRDALMELEQAAIAEDWTKIGEDWSSVSQEGDIVMQHVASLGVS